MVVDSFMGQPFVPKQPARTSYLEAILWQSRARMRKGAAAEVKKR